MEGIGTGTATKFNWFEEFGGREEEFMRAGYDSYSSTPSDTVDLTSSDICIISLLDEADMLLEKEDSLDEQFLRSGPGSTLLTLVQTESYGPGDTLVERVEELAGDELDSLIIDIQELSCAKHSDKKTVKKETAGRETVKKETAGNGYFNNLYQQLTENVKLTPVIRMFYEAELLKTIFSIRKEPGIYVDFFRNETRGYGRGRLDIRYIKKEDSSDVGLVLSREQAIEAVHALRQYDSLLADGSTENAQQAMMLAQKYFTKKEYEKRCKNI